MLGFNQAPTEGDPPIVALASEWWLARIRAYIWPGFFGAGLFGGFVKSKYKKKEKKAATEASLP